MACRGPSWQAFCVRPPPAGGGREQSSEAKAPDAPVMSSKMTAPYRTTRRVQFRDTDAAGIVHFSVFFNYMEETEHQLLRRLGLSVVLHDEQGTISWPRVSAQCDFRDSVRFEELLQIEMWVERLGEKSVTYAFQFACNGRPVASGTTTAVCCRMRPGATLQPIAIPSSIADKLGGLVRPNAEQSHAEV
jgi:4-hydroxybenzoyl-CoA thioesterase/acyl-CoA thioester hydrolase